MNIYNAFATLIIVLAHLLQTNHHRSLAPLLEAPEPDTTYSICYNITPPVVPFTIDPSPPVLAPQFDPDHAPIPPHTHMGATSTGHGANSFSVNWSVNLLVVIVSGLLVHEAIAWFILYIGGCAAAPSSSLDSPIQPPVSAPESDTGATPRIPSLFSMPSLLPSSSLPNEEDGRSDVTVPFNGDSSTSAGSIASTAVRSVRHLVLQPPSGPSLGPNASPIPLNIGPASSPVPSSLSLLWFPLVPVNIVIISSSGLAAPSSLLLRFGASSGFDVILVVLAGHLDSTSVLPTTMSRNSTTDALLPAPATTQSQPQPLPPPTCRHSSRYTQRFLDEITLTLTLSPSPSFVTRTPPAVLRIPTNLWEDPVDTCLSGESPVWDCYPRPTPRTPVDLDDDVTENHDQCVDTTGVVEPLVRVWVIDAKESPSTPTPSPRNAQRAEPTVESAGSSQAAFTRIPKLAPTSAWKRSISALVSGDGRGATHSVSTPISTTQTVSTSTGVAAPASSTTSSRLDTPKRLDWPEDIGQALSSSSGDIAAKKVEGETVGLKGDKRVPNTRGPVLDKCNCALKTALFEPESWNKFKFPPSCHPRPPIHFFAPRDADKSNPSTRIVVDKRFSPSLHGTKLALREQGHRRFILFSRRQERSLLRWSDRRGCPSI